MLILTRKLGESIAIGDDIKVTFLEIKGKQIKIGIDAPSRIAVHREELYNLIHAQNLQAAEFGSESKNDLTDIWDQLKARTKS